MVYDPKKGVNADIEACNRDLRKKVAKGMAEIGFIDETRPALFYDPDKLPRHVVDNLAAAFVVRLGKPLIVVEKPGLFKSKQDSEIGR